MYITIWVFANANEWILVQVLVDAECTHDGSIKHIQKFENWGWTTLQRRVLNAERIDKLNVLQVMFIFACRHAVLGNYLVKERIAILCVPYVLKFR